MGKGTESGCQARAGIQFAAASGIWNVEWKCKWKCGSWFGKSMERNSKMRQGTACEIAWKDLPVTNPS